MTATVQDSISCSVTYRWAAPNGIVAQPSERSTSLDRAEPGRQRARHRDGYLPD